MTATKTKAVAPNKGKTDTPKDKLLQLHAQPGKSQDRLMAEVLAEGVAGNADLVVTFSSLRFERQSLADCVTVLRDNAEAVKRGDMGAAEARLSMHATALDSIFTAMAARAAANVGHYPETAERYLRIALKAQNQCRMTLETLAAIKNPPVVYARQANINNGGQQQVNNGAAAPPPVRAAEVGAVESLEQSPPDTARFPTQTINSRADVNSN